MLAASNANAIVRHASKLPIDIAEYPAFPSGKSILLWWVPLDLKNISKHQTDLHQTRGPNGLQNELQGSARISKPPGFIRRISLIASLRKWQNSLKHLNESIELSFLQKTSRFGDVK